VACVSAWKRGYDDGGKPYISTIRLFIVTCFSPLLQASDLIQGRRSERGKAGTISISQRGGRLSKTKKLALGLIVHRCQG
jgi:hypothetical protein